MYNILTRETSIVSITLLGSIFRMNENTESLISARISCSLEAPAFMTAAKTCKSTITPIKHLKTYPKQPYMFDGKQNLLQYFVFMYYIKGYSRKLLTQWQYQHQKLVCAISNGCKTFILFRIKIIKSSCQVFSSWSGFYYFRAGFYYCNCTTLILIY